MKKHRVTLIFLVVCAVLIVAQMNLVMCAVPKIEVTLPISWVLEDETPYPDAESVYDPEGAGYVYYQNPDTASFVIIYYEKATAHHELDAMRDRAYENYQDIGSYPFESSGMFEVAGQPAGYVKAHDYDYDIYQLFIVTVIDDYFMEIFSAFRSGSQDETRAYELMNSVTMVGGEPAPADYTLIIIVVVAVVIVIVVLYILLRFLKGRKKTPKPAELRITAEPPTIIADGTTDSTITIQLFDKNGKPISALADTKVQITATKGKLETPIITIPKGEDKGITRIISTRESGAAQLSARAENLESMAINLVFVGRKRYCMHCGSIMEPRAKICQKCGKSPPAGVDTKECHNCKSVIPIVARFCSECGTGQVGVDTVCRNCRAVLPVGAKFCNHCGTNQNV